MACSSHFPYSDAGGTGALWRKLEDWPIISSLTAAPPMVNVHPNGHVFINHCYSCYYVYCTISIFIVLFNLVLHVGARSSVSEELGLYPIPILTPSPSLSLALSPPQPTRTGTQFGFILVL
ncbi:hypothetical protein J4Q44_G00240940 [Coregonus suidteri]|uniref:Uncharacterized protein n=1 Tax=Coregonus suidteri TaxID=861788 RepID=A0AAN8QGU6_9TELE